MSNIARKLCHEIVEPIIKPSSTESKKLNTSEKYVNTFSNIKKNVKPKRTLQIEKKYATKIEPSHITDLTTHKEKLGEKGSKSKLVNSAINTHISGPLRCDNNCITLIHKRDHYISCKCNLKTNLKGISKEIQTLSKNNYTISDKSCTHCVETVSCGTQFIDNINGILKRSCNRSKSKIAIKIHDNNETYKSKTKMNVQPLLNEEKFNLEKPHVLKSQNLRYVGAKHWALPNYPIRGPDF